MRHYEYKLPGDKKWVITFRLKSKRFPPGTEIRAVITDRDGTLLDCWEIPIDKDGKPLIRKRSLKEWAKTP